MYSYHGEGVEVYRTDKVDLGRMVMGILNKLWG